MGMEGGAQLFGLFANSVEMTIWLKMVAHGVASDGK